MAVEGTLDLFKLPEILQLIAQQKKTGILTVQGQHDIVAISFLNGRIVAADALNQSMEEGLAKVLVAEGMIGTAELARAQADHQASGERLIDVLVERGYVTRQRLLQALRLQTYRLLAQLLNWDEGDFKFYSGEEVSYEESFVPIPVEEILLHAVRDAESAEERRAAAPAARTPAPMPPMPTLPSTPATPSAAAGARTVRAPAPVPLAPAVAAELERRRAVGGGRAATPGVLPMPALPQAPAAAGEAAGRGEREGVVVQMPFRHMQVESSAVGLPQRIAARLLAVLAVALVAAGALRAPDDLVLPFPWQEVQRSALARSERASLFLKIDRAAKTFFLLDGHFPARLSQLERAGLLSPGDLRDPLGAPLQYAAHADGYSVQPVDARGEPRAGAESTEAITGNFLLDPQFLSVSPDSQAPLVLLD